MTKVTIILKKAEDVKSMKNILGMLYNYKVEGTVVTFTLNSEFDELSIFTSLYVNNPFIQSLTYNKL